MTREEEIASLRADLALFERARRERVLGKAVASSSYPETGSISFASTSLAEINREICRIRLRLRQLTGEPSGVGPIRPSFGSRA